MDLASAINSHSLTEMDFKFELDSKSSTKTASSKKSRRSGLPFGFSLSPREGAPEGSMKGSSTSPPKSRRSGGWAGDALKSAMRRSSTTTAAFFDQDQLDRKIDDDENIPVIPNLDDYDDEEISKAPMVGHRVSSYKELEMDLLAHSAFASLEDVNLRVLTSFMKSARALEEPDVPWTIDSLFTDLNSYNH